MGAPDERPPYHVAPPADTLGIRHVREALADLPFPTTRAELVARAGRWRVPITGVTFQRLEELLDGVPDRPFHDVAEVARAIERAHPALRE